VENRLEEILKEQGRLNYWLADKADIHRNTITRIIKGSYTPGLDVAHRIAKALNLSIYDIWNLK